MRSGLKLRVAGSKTCAQADHKAAEPKPSLLLRKCHVDGEASSGSYTDLGSATRRRVETLAIVPVNTQEKHIWILLEDLLSTLAVMDVPIKYQHPSYISIPASRIGSRNGDIVKETEALAPVARRVMPWGTAQCKSVSGTLLQHHLVDESQNASNRVAGCLE